MTLPSITSHRRASALLTDYEVHAAVTADSTDADIDRKASEISAEWRRVGVKVRGTRALLLEQREDARLFRRLFLTPVPDGAFDRYVEARIAEVAA